MKWEIVTTEYTFENLVLTWPLIQEEEQAQQIWKLNFVAYDTISLHSEASEQWIRFLLAPKTLFDPLLFRFSPPLSLSTSLPNFPLPPIPPSILQNYQTLILMVVAISGRLSFSRPPLLQVTPQRLGKFSAMLPFSLLLVSQFCSRTSGIRVR